VWKKLYTISIGQSTHWDFVKKSGLRRILFHKKSSLRRIFFWHKPECIGCEVFLSCLTIHWWRKWFELSILSDHTDINCTKQLLRNRQITKPLSNQISWDTNRTTPFQFQNSFKETMYSRGNASPKAYRFWNWQALRLLCLKGHDRVRGSTLWRHRWQEASEFLCSKTPFVEGVEQPKISHK